MVAPASCERCGEPRAVARCCRHLARGLATFVDGNGATLTCSACADDAAEHPVCAGCVEAVRAHNVAVGEIDRARGWALVPRAPYLAILGYDRPRLCWAGVGDFAKLGFTKVPRGEPRWLESMWVEITARDGDRFTGRLDNDPELIEKLAADASITFDLDQIVDVLPTSRLPDRDPSHRCAACSPDGRTLDDGDRKLLGDVAKVGFHVIKVFADEVGPGFAYSVGFNHSFDHPEVIAVGLDLETAHAAINRIGAALAAGGKPDLDRLLERGRVSLREIRKEKSFADYLGYGRWFYRAAQFPACQIVWRDDDVVL
jgi:hypothetical protein